MCFWSFLNWTHSLLVCQVDGGGGARGGGGGPWQSTPLKVQEREVGHLRRRGHLRQEPEGEEYFPWGRPGGGAPLLSNSGRRGYACNDSVKVSVGRGGHPSWGGWC